MKLVRFGALGEEKPGIIDAQGVIRDLSGHVTDIAGDVLHPQGLAALAKIPLDTLPVVDAGVRLGMCVGGTGKCICIGLNYSDHAKETGSSLPTEPMIFMKATSALCGANDPIILPHTSVKTDWEAELVVVIGQKAKYIRKDDVSNYIAGYTMMNDVSERDFQKHRAGQFTKGKSCDNFGPVGPWLVTQDEIADPQNLPIWLKVNGETMQQGSTADMIYHAHYLVYYLSQFMSLLPGDLISTGTPSGVGAGMSPPRFLRAGDTVELGIEGLGVQRQRVIADV